ncbi:ABC transporter permease [Catellatospora sp. TT07R-123]|uniref:ABC transporter permease n=1 Tax=Catellatospora sp. TT07R-123 TaxID=2733863 RepID=UPI001B18E146|nr:ABC transporter permease [Catellatospora sp. TT07R-123]GHJ46056.1 ABC transporter permease [Catellatospora sp. TT07R-123]
MGRYVIRRLLQFIPTVLGTLFLLHYLTSVGMQLTGNPVRALFGDKTPPKSTLDAITRALHLDDPCLKQPGNPCFNLFFQRIGVAKVNGHFDGYLQGNFGTDLHFRAVTEIVGDAMPFTLKITLIAFLVEAIVGILAGVLAGTRSGGFMDYFVKISTVLVISVPVFVLGLLIQEYVGVQFGNWLRGMSWVPEWISRGMFGAAYKRDYPFASLMLPGVVLGLLGLATTARLTRTSVQENLRADFVRTARAKGLTTKRVIGVHTLRNSLIPVVTNLGLSLAVYLTGAIVTEGIFNVPGIGNKIGRAIFQGESVVLIGITTMLVLAYLSITLLVDLLYAVLDPRIRYE